MAEKITLAITRHAESYKLNNQRHERRRERID